MPSSSGWASGALLSSSSQATSDGFTSTTHEAVDPFIENDLKSHETCSFDRLLEVFLSYCRQDSHCDTNLTSEPRTPNPLQSSNTPESLPGPDKTRKAATALSKPETACAGASPTSAAASEVPAASDTVLLNACLDSVLPLCDDVQFRELLTNYCTVGGREDPSYKPFSHMVNYALEALTRVDSSYIRPPSSNEILFHVNDPRKMEGSKKDSSRIPDINIVPLASAKRVHNLQGGNWTDLQEKSCLAPPKGHPFEWRDVIGVVELKRLSKFIELELPDNYEVSPRAPISPQQAQASDISSESSGTAYSVALSSAELDLNSIRDVDKPFLPTTTASISTESVDIPPTTISPPVSNGEGDANNIEHMEPQHWNKIKGYSRNKAIREAITRCGSHAVEMLNCSPGRRHAIALIMVGKSGSLSAISNLRLTLPEKTGTCGLGDLPRFLVLLLAFQRFTHADWGYDTELDPSIAKPTANEQGGLIAYPEVINIRFDPDVEVMIHPREILHRTYSLVGRGTYVIGATHSAGIGPSSAVAKMSWSDKRRTHEKDIIDCAYGGDEALSLHLPAVIAHRDGYDTEVIRKQLEIAAHSLRPSRVFRTVIFERLFPITQLSPENFVTAWIQCIKWQSMFIGHFLIWPRVQHHDLSPKNLMYRTRGGQIWGVVNDWDLAFAVAKSSPIEQFTGTVPFMALELLYESRLVEYQYRHDLESFMWIAIWVFLSNKGGMDSPPAELKVWCNGHQFAVYQEKIVLLNGGSRRSRPLDVWERLWNLAIKLMDHVEDEWLKRLKGRIAQEKSNDERLASFLGIVKTYLPPGYQFPDTPTVPVLDSQ